MDKNEEHEEDNVPESREKRIQKYLKEKSRYSFYDEKEKLNSNPITRRLKHREHGEDIVPESREMRIQKYLTEKSRYIGYRERQKLNSNPFTRRLKNRYICDYDNICLTKQIVDKFSPTNKLKDNTVTGPLDGKGSWKKDYCPSAIDTIAGEFCPASVADKDIVIKEQILKTQKYEDKVRREKYTPGQAKIDLNSGYKWEIWGDYLYGHREIKPTKPKEFKKKIKQTESSLPKPGTEKTFEEKLCDTIDSLDRESTSDRTASFTALQAALCHHLVPDVVKNNYAVIAEALKKTLRKGRGAEQIAAAKLLPILCVQLGEDQCEPLLNLVKIPLLDITMDKTIDASVRAECCQSLAILSFLSSSANGDILKLMKNYEGIFCGKYQQNDGSVNECPKAESVLRVVALDAWSLLLSKCSPAEVHALLGRPTSAHALSLSKLAQLLKAPSLEMQKSAGVALSLAYELGLEFSEGFGQEELATIIVDVEQLTKESSKFRAKEHRKVQRAIFRDVLKFLEDGVAPVKRICVGDDSMELDRWNLHVRYDRLAAGLGSGLQVSTGTSLLCSALLMRPLRRHDIEQNHHKEKPEEDASQDKARRTSRAKKPHHNTPEAKARNISRTKMRDKRSALKYYSTD